MTTPRVRGATIAMLLCLVVVAALLLPARPASADQGAVELVVRTINDHRAAAGLPSLDVDGRLQDVAAAWSGELARRGGLAHNPSLEADYAWDVPRAAENVGMARRGGASDQALAQRIVELWMGSPGHRANILGDYSDLGVGLARAGDALYATVDFVQASLPADAREALAESQELLPDGAAHRVVLARADSFADALAGAALAGPDAPVLLARAGRELSPALLAEIDRVTAPGATVYLLGGGDALTVSAEAVLTGLGLATRRLSGASRVETAVAVAREAVAVHGPPRTVLLASADAWPDAVTAGAYAARAGVPVLLTGGAALHPAVAQFLAEHRPDRVVAIGGSGVLSDAVVQQADADRVSGGDRIATSVAVARELWGRTEASAGDHFGLMPAYGSDGWAASLVHAMWAARHRAPLLLVGDDLPGSVRAYLTGAGYGPGVPTWFEGAVGTSASALHRARTDFGG